MDTKVPYLNISDKQYKLIGITWGFIFASMFHYYQTFEANQNSIVLTFFSVDFAIKALIYMVAGYIISYYGLRKLNS